MDEVGDAFTELAGGPESTVCEPPADMPQARPVLGFKTREQLELEGWQLLLWSYRHELGVGDQ